MKQDTRTINTGGRYENTQNDAGCALGHDALAHADEPVSTSQDASQALQARGARHNDVEANVVKTIINDVQAFIASVSLQSSRLTNQPFNASYRFAFKDCATFLNARGAHASQ